MNCAIRGVLLVFLPAFAGAAASNATTTRQLQTISGAELKSLRESGARVDLIDVRSPSDYRARHLVGARNVPFYLLTLSGIPKERRIVLYCSDVQCGLSTESARALLDRGYKNVSVLSGGLEAALAAGSMVEGEGPRVVHPQRMTPAALAERLAGKEPPVLVDSRTPSAFSAGRLPGARGFPLEGLRRSTPALPADREVVVYDSSSARAAAAAALLMRGGRTVFVLEGGLALWSREGRPLESGAD